MPESQELFAGLLSAPPVCNAFLKPGNISSIPVQIMPSLKPLVNEKLLTL